MPKFEAHVTVPFVNGSTAKRIGELAGWKYSQIEGDALMGPGAKAYLTAYRPNDEVLLAEMSSLERLLVQASVPVLRTKIERIVWDSRTGIDEIGKDAR